MYALIWTKTKTYQVEQKKNWIAEQKASVTFELTDCPTCKWFFTKQQKYYRHNYSFWKKRYFIKLTGVWLKKINFLYLTR